MMKALCTVLLLLGTTGACGSDDPPKPDAGSNADAAIGGADAMPGAPIAFMEECDVADDQCVDDLICFNFNNKGPHCTHSCSGDPDCEDPSPGCSGMGVCKAP